MNGYQRIEAALAGRYADTVPVMLHNLMMAVREAGLTHRRYRENPEAIAQAYIQAVDTYAYDGICVDVDTVTLAGALGVAVDFPEDEPARCHDPLLTRLEAVRDLPPVNVAEYRPVQVWLEGVRLIRKHFGNSVYLRGNCDQCPFSLASMLRSPEAWLMDLLDPDRQDLVHALLDYCTQATRQFIELMAGTGAHMVSNGDSPAGPAMISPEMYRTYALPYEKRIVAAAHARGLPYLLHICGDTGPILRDMLDSGADCLELDYKTDVNAAHQAMRDRAVFVGNIDPSGVLAFGTPTVVRETTLELLKTFADTPRFILNAGCAIPSITPSENLRTMIQTARSFR